MGIFYWCIQNSPVDSCSAVNCNFGVLAGEDEYTSFYSAISYVQTHDPRMFLLDLAPPCQLPWLIWKDHDAGNDWRWEEKGMTEDEMVGWHHQLYWHEFNKLWELVINKGSLACCSPWDCKQLDTTEWLNWTELILSIKYTSSNRTLSVISWNSPSMNSFPSKVTTVLTF